MTKQNVFDRVKVHLLSQMDVCSDGTSMACKYRLVSGQKVLKCAIGALIEDNEYKPEMEGQRVGMLVSKYPELEISKFTKEDSENIVFLTELQSLHDMNEPEYWGLELKILANKYKLNYE